MGGAVTGDLAKGLPKGHDGTGPAAASDGMRPGVWGNRLNLDRWVPYRSAGAVSCRVFCFPHTAGNATFYRPLRHFMRAGIDFCPIELPGRAARIGEPPVTDIDRLLDTLSRTIRPLMTVPFAFFGHSTGACIAYQAARKLRAADGRRAGHLFVSARAAPDVARKGPSPHSLKAWGSFTAAAFRVRLFAGGHFYLTGAGATVADEIARDLAESFGLAGGQMAEAG